MKASIWTALGISLAVTAAASSSPSRAADAVDAGAAKKEGNVVWYTSTPIETAQKIASAFEKQTGIKVEMFRSGGTQVLRRFQQEAEARRVAADVMTTSDPAASAVLARQKMF